MKEYLKLLSSRYGLMGIFGALLLVPDSSLLSLMGFVLVDTSFDVLGFDGTDFRRGSRTYRIIQKMFQLSVLGLIFVHVGHVAVIACLTSSWFLVSDVLYYFALSISLEPFSWFRISPVNILFITILRKPASPVWAVRTSAIVGFTLAAAICFFG